MEDAESWSLIETFVAEDRPARQPLCERWIAFLRRGRHTLLADLAEYEYALPLGPIRR